MWCFLLKLSEFRSLLLLFLSFGVDVFDDIQIEAELQRAGCPEDEVILALGIFLHQVFFIVRTVEAAHGAGGIHCWGSAAAAGAAA